MKINPLVKLSFQDYGTNILLIMEGKPADNVLQLNSFVNFGGVDFGARVDYPIDKPDRQIGQFWTTRERVLSYFQFRAFMCGRRLWRSQEHENRGETKCRKILDREPRT
jgi:hypothetical protein